MGTDSAKISLLTLTEREKETLRLLIRGYDAKSIARHLDLSVHTINERLRDARRKLSVASSREAARLLAETERADPEHYGDKVLGVTATPAAVLSAPQADHRQGAAHRLAWLSGGMLVMSLLIAAVVLVSAFHGGTTSGAQSAGAIATTNDASASMSQGAARQWLGFLDKGNWEASWRAAAGVFQSHISAAQWATTIQPVRLPLGATSSRTFQKVTKTNSLPGVPAGDYEIIQFRTDFAHKPGAIETITLAHESDGWKVAGYFIK
ncbi:helix-turn-helix domain-containing protein (plasmid) [Sphingomonas aurantiaca]